MKMFKGDHGFSIVEVVIASAILFVLATGAMVGLTAAARAGTGDNMRERALALANDRMEQYRNLPYDKIGTQAGIPTADIPNVETVGDFTVNTTIVWSEDPATGLTTSKNILIEVTWTEPTPGGQVAIESNIAGKSSIANAGDVRIYVLDADTSAPIQGALLTIKPLVGPTASASTNASGYARWGKVPAGKVVISGTKSGYALNLAPLANASVIADELNEWTIYAAKPSDGTVRVRDQFGNAVVGATVTISGSTGTHVAPTNEAGEVLFEGLAKGTYTVSTSGPAGYNTGSGTLGILTTGGSFTTSVSVIKQARAIVLVRDTQGAVVPGATVVLTGSGTINPTSATSGSDGKTVHVLSGSGTFIANVTKAGYLGDSGSASIASGSDGNITVTIEKLEPMSITVTVKDAVSGDVVSGAAVSVTGPGTVSPTSATTGASGQLTFSVGLPGVYTVAGTKAAYTPGSTTSPAIVNGGSADVTLDLAPITDGVLSVKYTSNPSPNPKTVYIYTPDGTRLSETLSFTSRNQTKTITLPSTPAGVTYYVSTFTSFNSSKARPGVVYPGQTTSVSLGSTN